MNLKKKLEFEELYKKGVALVPANSPNKTYS